jgi:AcrR family transcriptional regulator
MASATSSPKRPRARRGEGDALREEILDATEGLLLDAGDEESVSIRAVAERVGRTSPAIYLHFPDKDTLIHSVCDRMFQRLADISAAAQAPYDEPTERIRACARSYVEFAVEHPAVYRVLFMGTDDWTGEMGTLDHLQESVAFRSLYDNVANGYERGLFVGPGPELSSLGMWMAVHGVASLLIAKPAFAWPPIDDLVDLVVDTQLRGVLPRS